MNFPHKSPVDTGARNRANKAAHRSDYEALLAHVIARQMTSVTTKKYTAYTKIAKNNAARTQSMSFQDRIQLFAGGEKSTKQLGKNSTNLAKGHFRPDLVAQVKEEKAV